jgi:murein DD-endopeptidase MepM/ murein hydrolase activator NlpD
MRSGRMHKGLDIAGGGAGSPIYAAASGTVIYTGYGYDGGYGNNIEISHGSGYVTKYAHLSTINVNVGQTVERGEVIGGMGETGRAYGVHLHFEVHVNGATQNPSNFL